MNGPILTPGGAHCRGKITRNLALMVAAALVAIASTLVAASSVAQPLTGNNIASYEAGAFSCLPAHLLYRTLRQVVARP